MEEERVSEVNRFRFRVFVKDDNRMYYYQSFERL